MCVFYIFQIISFLRTKFADFNLFSWGKIQKYIRKRTSELQQCTPIENDINLKREIRIFFKLLNKCVRFFMLKINVANFEGEKEMRKIKTTFLKTLKTTERIKKSFSFQIFTNTQLSSQLLVFFASSSSFNSWMNGVFDFISFFSLLLYQKLINNL